MKPKAWHWGLGIAAGIAFGCVLPIEDPFARIHMMLGAQGICIIVLGLRLIGLARRVDELQRDGLKLTVTATLEEVPGGPMRSVSSPTSPWKASN